MKVSLNTIKQFTDVDVSVDELVAKINQQLGGVEEVIDLGVRYKDAVIAKVARCDKHPNADKLSVCEIDAGTGENIQVVCGANNVRADIFVVWLPPKSIVPSTFDGSEPFVLKPKELRGIISNGMLASAKELGIGEDHDGILEISPEEWKPNDVEIKPGASFAEAYGLDDTIIDIENKMFTHRPDLFGQLGVAREIAGIGHRQFTSPDWYTNEPAFENVEDLKLDVFNEAGDNVPRFMAVAIQNVQVKPSPLWLQIELVRLGGKPINNIVDVTNYIMLLTAQPTHAYDYDKLRGGKLGTRMAKKGEQAELLNGKVYELNENDIVIVDGEGVVGLGGIMGGGNSEVSAETKNIVLEVANFDMYAVRKTSMRHGLFTDALTRFNKGQSPLQNSYVMSLLMQSIHDVAGGEQASEAFDSQGQPIQENEPALVGVEFINQRLGLQLSKDDMVKLLRNVEFDFCEDCEAGDHKENLHYVAPFWRTDIELPEDVVEEVGRLYGFNKLPHELPQRSIKPAPQNELLELKQHIRQTFANAGANEVLTYSFIHANLLDKVGQDKTHAFKLTNALSPELQYYRLSLLPSLLGHVHANIKSGHDEFALFELGKSHLIGQTTDDGLPREDELTALVVAAADKLKKPGAAYYAAKHYLTHLMSLELSFVAVPEDMQQYDMTKPFDMNRTALIYHGETFLGIIGEFRNSVAKALKLPSYCAGFELDTKALQDVLGTQPTYQPLSRFPTVWQDLTLKVASDTAFVEVRNVVSAALDANAPQDSFSQFEPLGIYQSKDDTAHQNITFRISVTGTNRTLTDKAVNATVAAIVAAANQQLGAEQV